MASSKVSIPPSLKTHLRKSRLVVEHLREMLVFLQRCAGRNKAYVSFVQAMIDAADQVIDRLQPDVLKDAANGKPRRMKQVH